MNPELPHQVDQLYRDSDALAFDILRKIARKATTPEIPTEPSKDLCFWLQREEDCLKALSYAREQMRKIRAVEA